MENVQSRQCPHCQQSITLPEAIIILHGSGCEEIVKVRLKDGTEAFVEAGLVNPKEVEFLDA